MKSNAVKAAEITVPRAENTDPSEASIERSEALLPEGYSLVKPIGSGGSGIVYQASHPDEGLVAVKVLSAEFVADAIASERFRREIGAYLGISHPNVVGGKRLIEERERDLLALVMEFVPGNDLSLRLQCGEPLPLFEALGLLVQLCDGLGAIHRHGIIHRDVKPENLIINPVGLLKVTDLGIASIPGTSRLTEHGGVVGTLQYASPEYLISSELHPRGDIYALGLIAYEMLTGRSPFEGGEFYTAITRRIQSDPPPPSTYNPMVPPWLDELVLTAAAREPAHRYQSIGEVKKALARGIKEENLPIATGLLVTREALQEPRAKVSRAALSRSGGRRRSRPPSDSLERDFAISSDLLGTQEGRSTSEPTAPPVETPSAAVRDSVTRDKRMGSKPSDPSHVPTAPPYRRTTMGRSTGTHAIAAIRSTHSRRARPTTLTTRAERLSSPQPESLLAPPSEGSRPSLSPTIDAAVRFIGSATVGAAIGYQLLRHLLGL